MKKENKDKPHYAGHRQRMKERLLNSPKGLLTDYELMEMVLFLSIPRKDTKPLAKKLVNQFGSVNRIITAESKFLKEVEGITDSIISSFRILEEVNLRALKEEFTEKPILQSWQAVLHYCRISMNDLTHEQLRVLYLNAKNMLLKDRVEQNGTINSTAIYVREIIKNALDIGAVAVILVHNHPSGDPTPSNEDIQMTLELAKTGKPLGIHVHDHLVIGGNKNFSFKYHGLI